MQSHQAQDNVTLLLGQIFSIQRCYGDTGEELETTNDFFQEGLEDYCFEDIKQAFKLYIRSYPDIPTLSDIIKIVEQIQREKNVSFVPDRERYKTLKSLISKGGERFVSESDKAFMVEFERYQ